MDSAQLRAAVAERQRAIAAFREAKDDEPQMRAWDAAEEQRAIIDQATIDMAERLEAIEDAEARAKAAFKEAHPDPDPIWGTKEGFGRQIRKMFENPSGPLHVPIVEGLPLPGEKRTDYPLLTGGATTYSSYLVPTLLWNDLVYHLNAQSAILQAGPTIIRTPGMQSLDVPVLLTDAAALAGTEGAAQSNAAYPVFSKVTLKAFREDGFMSISEEMLKSTDFPMYDILSEVANRALATKAATDYCLGAGSTAPDGLFIAAKADCSGNFTTAAAADTFTMDELLKVFYTLHSGYRAVGSWIVSQPAMKVIASMTDDEGRYLWSPSVVAGQPDRLWGRPIYEDAHADANGAIATKEEHVIFGDISKFWIRYAGGIDIAVSRDMKFNEWENVIRFALWHDCNIVDVAAFAGLTQA